MTRSSINSTTTSQHDEVERDHERQNQLNFDSIVIGETEAVSAPTPINLISFALSSARLRAVLGGSRNWAHSTERGAALCRFLAQDDWLTRYSVTRAPLREVQSRARSVWMQAASRHACCAGTRCSGGS
mmetsp:Transcript_15649/g.30895  ORF Transcript_15649/g.30895 Transcript_15649/m.30895 type:complete len:129 (-) Transcript_15649:75-461(-)